MVKHYDRASKCKQIKKYANKILSQLSNQAMQMNKYIYENLSWNLHPEVRLYCHSFNKGGRRGRIDTKYFWTAILLYYICSQRKIFDCNFARREEKGEREGEREWLVNR